MTGVWREKVCPVCFHHFRCYIYHWSDVDMCPICNDVVMVLVPRYRKDFGMLSRIKSRV